MVLASLVAPTAAERAETHRLAAQLTDWNELFALAAANATVPLIQYGLQRDQLFELVPSDVAARFQSVSAGIARTNQRRLDAAVELLARFHRGGITCVVLKGMLFASEIYDNPHYKRMNDIDILVDITQIPAVIDVYRELGLFSVSELLGKEPKVREQRSHHLPSFVSRDGALVVGTHWGLITPLAPYRIDYGAIWSRVREIDFYGVPAWAMAHEDNLHHLCVHLPYYKTGVRELADIWNLVRFACDQTDWTLLHAEVTSAGTENLVYHALSLVNRIVPEKNCENLIGDVESRSTRFYRYDVARKTRDIHALLRCRSTHTSVIEKAYTEFNATSAPAEKRSRFVRLWSNLILVPAPEAAKMSSLRDPSPRQLLGARISAPLRLTKVFQRDLGPWLFPAALVKTVADVVWAYVRQLRAGDPAADLDTFAADVGVSRTDLQAIMDSQE